jgi:putative peptidoglycan lipid II flippase
MPARLFRFLRPSRQHSAFSATVLLMVAVMLSRIVGYLREAYIAYAFGAGAQTDAYVAAFTLPDWLNYVVAGATASITFVSIYTRFLAENREDEAGKTYSVILTVMTTVLIAGTIVAEIFTPEFSRWMFKGFTGQQLDLCVHLTRILLPAQIFFYVGGVVSAVLLSHRLFLYPAFGPLLYNVCIILGGVIGGKLFGVQSLAYGALAGSLAGPFLVNVLGATRIGPRFRPSFNISNPAFREWVRLSIPLMLGVSLVTVDDWILRHYASYGVGEIARLNFAKRLFAVPIAVLGQATGQASLPFFARLFNERRLADFAAIVKGSVYRVGAAALLATSWMMAASLPLVDLVYRHGRFQFSDSGPTALYFFLFSMSLVFWSTQGLYARAFYAAGNTLTPMIASTIITLLSLPVYAALFHWYSVLGLAVASDVGILANTAVLAWLLARRGLVPASQLPGRELAKAAAVSVVAYLLASRVAQVVPVDGARRTDLLSLGMVTLTWAAAIAAGLWLLRSQLPTDLRRRRETAYPHVAEAQAAETARLSGEP